MSLVRPTAFQLPLIGWREDVALPFLGDGTLIAKIDTGARSAALHAEELSLKGKTAYFTVELSGRKQRVKLPLVGVKRIKSSSGHSEKRAVVETEIIIGGHRLRAELTLTDRTDMGVPMLLGRTAIKGRFIVNPARSFILSRRKKKVT
jgi:hypothetical protein